MGERSGRDQVGQGRLVAESVGRRRWKFTGKLTNHDKEKARGGIFISHCSWMCKQWIKLKGLGNLFKSMNNELWFVTLRPFLQLHFLSEWGRFSLFSSFHPGMHLFIHRLMAGWLLPILAKDPWRGLGAGRAPLGYWTGVKAIEFWGEGWMRHYCLLLFTDERRGGRGRKPFPAISGYLSIRGLLKYRIKYNNRKIIQQWRTIYGEEKSVPKQSTEIETLSTLSGL